MSRLENLLTEIQSKEAGSAAKKAWNPQNCGEIDIRISANGTWYHEGRPFQRGSLVKLFSSVLRKESDGAYYLLTPAEKMHIQVDDAPFVITEMEQITEKEQTALLFTTNLGEQVIADREHAIRIEFDSKTSEPRPYIHCRDNLDALINRSVYMELVGMGELFEKDNKTHLGVSSQGVRFDLGSIEE
ncbi:MAG: DUF1285 domain-containing protein [Sedimenticola sp.]|nr:DUF1285 domain-containing protein [Sedimenticola sp.]